MTKKAVIPAAGFASRLRPLTDNTHKTMLPIGPTTLMELILKNLQFNGIEEVLVVTGFQSEALKDYVREKCGDITPYFVHNEDFSTTNNAYSLYLAREFADGEEFILLDSDIAFEPETLKKLLDSPFENALALRKNGEIGEEEMKVFSDDGKTISRITKDGPPEEALGESVGIEKFTADFSKELFSVLEKRVNKGSGRTEYYEASFQELLERGRDIFPVDVSDTLVMEVDFAEDLKKVERDLLPLILAGQEAWK